MKQAFQAAGYTLEYHRGETWKGYALKGQPALSLAMKRMIQASIAEVDPRQLDVYRHLSPAEKFGQGISLSNLARKAVAYRIRQENPGLSEAEANRLSLQRAYRP